MTDFTTPEGRREQLAADVALIRAWLELPRTPSRIAEVNGQFLTIAKFRRLLAALEEAEGRLRRASDLASTQHDRAEASEQLDNVKWYDLWNALGNEKELARGLSKLGESRFRQILENVKSAALTTKSGEIEPLTVERCKETGYLRDATKSGEEGVA